MRSHVRIFIAIVATALILTRPDAMAQTPVELKLLQLAKIHFNNDINPAEEKLFRNTANGTKADCTKGPGPENDPANIAGWEDDRIIRADRLVWLCVDPEPSGLVTSRGVEIAGARIDGRVDFAWAKIQFPVRTYRCAFTDDLILDRASLRSLQLQNTYIRGLHGDGLNVERDILFEDGFRANGSVWLQGATVGGSLGCDGGRFSNPSAYALELRSVKIGTNLLLGEGFRAEGEVWLFDVTVGGIVDCDGGQFINPQSTALNLENAKTGGVLMGKGFKAEGLVSLNGATISGYLECDGGQFSNQKSTALSFENSKTGTVFMGHGFRAEGRVSLNGATISGNLECPGGQFSNPNETALDLSGAKTGGVLLRDGFRADGEVRLDSTVIGGDLDCVGGQFINLHGIAISLQGAKIGNVLMRGGFRAEGEVSLNGATVSGSMQCQGGQFFNPRKIALSLETAKTGDVLLRDGFRADGEVRLASAVIGGDLQCDAGAFKDYWPAAINADKILVEGDVSLSKDLRVEGSVWLRSAKIVGTLSCSNAHFINPDRLVINAWSANIEGSVIFDAGSEVNGKVIFRDARVDHDLIVRDITSPEKAIWDLTSAKVKTLLNQRKGWPLQDNLFLHGFTYDELASEADLSAQTQIKWIQRQSRRHFVSQPYEQLAAVFRNMGLEEESVKVMIAKNEEHGRHARGFKEIIWYDFFGPFLGFGYRPWNAFYASLVVILFGYFPFRAGKRWDIITPTKDDAYGQNARLSELYPKFNAFIYSLETFVPLVKLGIGEHWMPNANRGAELRRLHKLTLWFVQRMLQIRYGKSDAALRLYKFAPLKLDRLASCSGGKVTFEYKSEWQLSKSKAAAA